MISVVIPLYNKEKEIEQTIQSVLNQTFKDFELIVVDDGSTDKSLDIVKLIDDKRICIINKVNGGVSSARNTGISFANYKYIAFLDADDVWLSNHLEIMVSMIKMFPNEKFFSSSFLKHIEEKRNMKLNPEYCHLINDYFKASIYIDGLVHTSSVVVLKDLLISVGSFNESLRLGEDLDLWSRLSRVSALVKSEVVTSYYVQNTSNNSRLNGFRFDVTFYPSIRIFIGLTYYERLYYIFLRRNIIIDSFRCGEIGLCIRLLISNLIHIPEMIYLTLLRKLI